MRGRPIIVNYKRRRVHLAERERRMSSYRERNLIAVLATRELIAPIPPNERGLISLKERRPRGA